MTKTQFRKNTKALKKDILKLIDNRIEKAIESGAIDFDKYENNYLLPKIFISAVASEIEFQFRPLTKEGIKERNNLKLHL